MREDIDWRILKGLFKLYKDGRTTNKLLNNNFVKFNLFERRRLIRHNNSNINILEARPGYKEFFEEHFLDQYNYYLDFFNNADLDSSGLKQYDAYDLETLMFIYKNSNELREGLTTVRIFSSVVFRQKDSKYLENKPGLCRDVLKLLRIEKFPDESKDNQWKISQDCEQPEAILLCENFDFIKAYWNFTKNNIELWYAGGSNTSKLKRISKICLELPLYYVCDWDYHGLKIYERIVKIFKAKNKAIILITPFSRILKPIDSGHHKSRWLKKEFSGLDVSLYSENQKHLINMLISKNVWIEEQTIDPITFIVNNLN